MKTEILCAVCGAYAENAYLVLPEGRDDCFLIDPGDDPDRLRDILSSSGRKLAAILLTHGHFDHMLSAEPLQKETDAPVYIAAEDAEMLSDAYKCSYNAACSSQPCPREIKYTLLNEEVTVCGCTLQVLKTPGHTGGSVCFLDRENGVLFSGDTLFLAGFGRMDLYGGDRRKMLASLKKLFELPERTRVLCGHGGETEIGAEKARYRL